MAPGAVFDFNDPHIRIGLGAFARVIIHGAFINAERACRKVEPHTFAFAVARGRIKARASIKRGDLNQHGAGIVIATSYNGGKCARHFGAPHKGAGPDLSF